MSEVNPTNSKSYRPGDEEKGYNDLVTIVLTKRECSDLLTAMNELTAGPYAPSEKEWQWMEDVMRMPTRESLMALFDKVDEFQEGDLRSSK